MSIGFIIRQERLKQNIKQANLCIGICSVSYLSKIERNATQPSEEVLTLLLNRLKLNPNEITFEEENAFIISLQELYKGALTKRDMVAINSFLVDASKNPISFSLPSNHTLYTLLIFRLYLIQNDDMNKIRHLAKILESLDKKLSDREQFLLLYNLGLFHYEDREYSTSLSYMKRALEFCGSPVLEDWEIADFYNALSLTYYRNNELAKASYYASLSLPIFKELLLFSRLVDNHIILGNISKGLKDYEKAEKNLIAAQRLAVELGLENKEAMILHNIGSLKAILGDTENAIHYFSMSLSKREIGSESYFLTVLNIVKEYSKEKNRIQVIRWCDEALSLLGNTLQKNKRFKPYYVHFVLYKAFHSFDDKLESTLKKTIKFFEKEKDYRHVQKYSYLLADYYSKRNKYKAAVIYYEKIKVVSYGEKMIKHWEDL